MTKYIMKISDELKNTCGNCGRFTTGFMYGQGNSRFSITEQFENKVFFCTDKCAETKTGKTVI